MKKFVAMLIIVAALSGCAAKDNRVPSGASASPGTPDEDVFRTLPGDENIQNSEVAYNLALEYAGGRNMPAAHHYIDLATRLEVHAKYSYTKGVFYLGEKRYEKALFYLNRAMAEDTGELQARLDITNAQGIALMQLKRFEEAKAKFRGVINTEGMISRFNAYYNMGIIYLEENNLGDAENSFRKAIEENPNDYRLYMKLGKIAKAKEDYLSAFGDYQKAGELVEPVYSSQQIDGPEIFCNLGESLVKLNKIGEARNAFMKVIKISPEGPYGLRAKEFLSKLPAE